MGEAAEAFGSEWLAALSKSAAGIEADPGLCLVLEQAIDREGHRNTHWTVTVADGRVAVDGVTRSIADSPNGNGQTRSSETGGIATDDRAMSVPVIRLSCDRSTAEGIHDGTISASAAFLDGRLRIGGDWRRLMASREHLAAIAAQLHR